MLPSSAHGGLLQDRADCDLLERVTDPLSRTWTFDHDAAGNLTKTAYPSGSTATRTFNDDELLESLTAGPLGYTFAYSPTHALTSVTDTSSRTWVYEYDEGDRLTRASDTVDPAVSGGFDVARSYDAAGNVSGIRASGEDTRTYAYDLAGRLTSLGLPSDPGTATAFAYDRSGLLTGRTLPDGSAASWSYDAAGRLSSIADTMPSGVLAFDYMRDANGNVTAENDARYGYDAPNRLTSWYDPSTDATTTYDYDAAYNLTGVSVDGSTTASFAFDAADRISSPGYTYDANGNMTSDGAQTYDYDTLNRLSRVKDAEGTAIATYAYDASNRRISSTDSSGTTYFHYDGASPNVIAETDGQGGTIASYAYDAAGRLHSMRRGGETYYYHANGHGDVVALTDASGEVVNSYRYDPWGKVLSASETVANPYRYAGYRYDDVTGLYHLWNRYYSPTTMRFITKDLNPGAVRNPASLNGYSYCWGNPVNLADMDGLEPHGAYMADGLGAGGGNSYARPDIGGATPTLDIEKALLVLVVLRQAVVYAPALAPYLADKADKCTQAGQAAMPISEANAGHIFRAAHLIEDSPASRALLQGTVSPANLTNYNSATNVYTYRALMSDGRQVWVDVWNGMITNGGINAVPR